MTTGDLKVHADNLRETLHRKIAELWDCPDGVRRTDLLAQTRALRNRIAELDEITRND
jgi:hypothetical protein